MLTTIIIFPPSPTELPSLQLLVVFSSSNKHLQEESCSVRLLYHLPLDNWREQLELPLRLHFQSSVLYTEPVQPSAFYASAPFLSRCSAKLLSSQAAVSVAWGWSILTAGICVCLCWRQGSSEPISSACWEHSEWQRCAPANQPLPSKRAT